MTADLQHPFACVIVAEGECEQDVFTFATEAELTAFQSGVGCGAELYGCGSCAAYGSNDLSELDEDEDEETAAAVRKALGPWLGTPPVALAEG